MHENNPNSVTGSRPACRIQFPIWENVRCCIQLESDIIRPFPEGEEPAKKADKQKIAAKT
jgi:hypothetical protein